MSAWHHNYDLLVMLTNCSSNYGPWQFPEKLIPVVILKAVAGESILFYGDGLNVRDWLYVEDYVDALLLAACRGGWGSATVWVAMRSAPTGRWWRGSAAPSTPCGRLVPLPHSRPITRVTDHPGQDRHYSVDPIRIKTELGGQQSNSGRGQSNLLTIHKDFHCQESQYDETLCNTERNQCAEQTLHNQIHKCGLDKDNQNQKRGRLSKWQSRLI